MQDQRHFLKEGESLTAKVGSKSANAWGLYDMLGNAWEWTDDWYAEDYYGRSPASDPRGPAEGTVRVRRGGAWNTFPLYARAAYRNWNSPSTRFTLLTSSPSPGWTVLSIRSFTPLPNATGRETILHRLRRSRSLASASREAAQWWLAASRRLSAERIGSRGIGD